MGFRVVRRFCEGPFEGGTIGIGCVYDGLGRRQIVREYAWNGSGWQETNEIHIIYDGYMPIQERDSNDNVLVTYTRGLDLSGSLQGAGGVGGLLARTDTNGSTFYHGDGAGNVTALMDGQEDIVSRYMYGPFGKLVGKWGAMANANEMQFSSMPRDNLSGLSLYPFRAYEPNFQRWLNQDPIQEMGGINLYRAMGNNPLSLVDPRGLASLEEEGMEEDQLTMLQEGGGRFEPDNLGPGVYANNLTVQRATEMERDAGELPPPTTGAPPPTEGESSAPSPAAKVPCPNTVYRSGRPSPSNLKTRPGENAVSFRDSLSNPYPNVGRPVFQPGADYFGLDTSQLPEGSVIYDNAPPGHVSIQGVSPNALQNAVNTRGSFPE